MKRALLVLAAFLVAAGAFSGHAITAEDARARPEAKELLEGKVYFPGDTLHVAVTRQGKQGVSFALRETNAFRFSVQEWKPLESTAESKDYYVTIPQETPQGYYTFKAASNPLVLLVSGKEVKADKWIGATRTAEKHFTIAVAHPLGSLTVFTPNARQVYVAGEDIEFDVAVKSKKPTAATLSCTLTEAADGEFGLELVSEKLSAPWGVTTRAYVVPGTLTAMLKPGRYVLRTRFGDMKANVVEIELVSPTRRTNYPVIYDVVQGKGYPRFWAYTSWLTKRARLQNDQESRGSVFRQKFGATGFNMVKMNGMYASFDSRRDPLPATDWNVDQLLRPSSEVLARPFAWNAWLQEMLRAGLGLVLQPPSRDPALGVPEYIARQTRMFELQAQAMRRYPSFIGILPGCQDEHNTLMPGKDPWGKQHMSYLGTGVGSRGIQRPNDNYLARVCAWQRFQEQTGVEFESPLRVGQMNLLYDEHGGVWSDREFVINWGRYYHQLRSNAQTQWHGGIARTGANILLAGGRRHPVQDHTLYDPLNESYWATTDFEHGSGGLDVIWLLQYGYDWGIEAFTPSILPDLFHTQAEEGRPLWHLAVGSGPCAKTDLSPFMRDAIESIGHGAVPGFAMEDCGGLYGSDSLVQNTWDGWAHQEYGRRERVKLVNDILTRYGDTFLRLETDKDLAILVSFTQGVLANKVKNPYGSTLWEAATACLFAHYPAKFVTETDVRKGRLKDYKVLLIVNVQHALPEEAAAGVQAFIKAGGVVLVDELTTIEIPGAKKLGLSVNALTRWLEDNNASEASSPLYAEATYWNWWRTHIIPQVPAFKKKLAEVLPAFADCASTQVLLSRRSCGDGTYLFAANYTPVTYEWNAQLPRPLGTLGAMWTVPVREEISVPGGEGVIYDLLEQKEVTTHTEGGRRFFEADFSAVEGRIYCMLPERIGRTELTTLPKVKKGTSLPVEVRVVGASGRPVNAALPVEITLSDAGGVVRERVFRAATADGLRESFAVPLNESSAAYTVTVTDLLARKVASRQVAIKGSVRVNAKAEVLPDCVLFDPKAVRTFLNGERSLVIALDKRQAKRMDRLALAQSLADLLESRGISCRLEDVADLIIGTNRLLHARQGSLVPPAPMVLEDVILMGGLRENELIDALHRTDILQRPLSESYPGPGRCVVQHAFSAFSGGRDALCILAPDLAGLQKGIAEVGKLLDQQSVPLRDRFAESRERARLALLPSDVKSYWKKVGRDMPQELAGPPAMKGKPSAKGTALSRADVPHFHKKIGVPIWTISLSADGKTIAAGTDSQFENLYLLDAESGRINTRADTPGRWIHKAAFVPAGGRTLASVAFPGLIVAYDASGKKVWEQQAAIPLHGKYGGHGGGSKPADPAYFHVHPSGEKVFYSEKPGVLVCRDTKTNKTLWKHEYNKPVKGEPITYPVTFAMSPDGAFLALATRRADLVKYKRRGWDVEFVKVQPADNLVTVRIINAADGKEVSSFTREKVTDVRLALAPGGKSVLLSYAFKHHGPYGWRTGTWVVDREGKVTDKILTHVRQAEQWTGAFSPDGTKLVLWPLQSPYVNTQGALVPSCSLQIRDIASKEAVVLKTDESVADAAWTPDGRHLVYSRWDGYIYYADAAGKTIWKQSVGSGARVALGADGSVYAGTGAGWVCKFSSQGNRLWEKKLP